MGLLANESLVGLRSFTADEVLSPYVYVFYAAYITSLIFTPVMRSIATYYGIIDRPDGRRKMHSVPVAYLGGMAVFLGWMVGLAMSQLLPLHRLEEGLPRTVIVSFAIVAGACIVVLLGLCDDVMHMTPGKKIFWQIFAALCLLRAKIGLHSAWIFVAPILQRTQQYLGVPSGNPDLLYDHWGVLVLSSLFVIFLVVLCCNATNLMDGLDGLCGGVTAVISGGFLFLAVNLAMFSGALNANQDGLRVVLGLALLGGVLGFVPYNFNPASIFMGDAGSMFLGFCCATMMILFASDAGHFKWFLASMVMFSLPLLDTTLAFVRRYVNGRPLFSADHYHFHHQLVARGFSVKQTVVISYGLSIIFCLLGAAIVYTRTRYAVAIYLIVFGSIIVAAFKMGMVHERVTRSARAPIDLGRRGERMASHEAIDLAEQLLATKRDEPDVTVWGEKRNSSKEREGVL